MYVIKTPRRWLSKTSANFFFQFKIKIMMIYIHFMNECINKTKLTYGYNYDPNQNC